MGRKETKVVSSFGLALPARVSPAVNVMFDSFPSG